MEIELRNEFFLVIAAKDVVLECSAVLPRPKTDYQFKNMLSCFSLGDTKMKQQTLDYADTRRLLSPRLVHLAVGVDDSDMTNVTNWLCVMIAGWQPLLLYSKSKN